MKSLAVLGLALASCAVSLAQSAPEFGTAQVTYVQIPGAAFVAQNSNSVLAVLNNGLSGQSLRVVGGSGIQYFTAPVQVPSGALLKSLRLDECDDSGVGNVAATLVVADALGNVQTTSTTMTSDGSGCESMTTDLTGLALTVDNNLKHYYVVASLTNAGAPLVGLAGVVVGYQLQVSPGPGAATFGDVPTNHPFFQFVEALAASGITAGCGNGNFCPDAPLTRGQMAVFLSKALGLYWPGE
jgi:S-layer family protein